MFQEMSTLAVSFKFGVRIQTHLTDDFNACQTAFNASSINWMPLTATPLWPLIQK